MVYLPSERHSVFDDLLSATYLPKITGDRRCPHDSCPYTRGGCECVQSEGDPGLPIRYRVRRVIRVEDARIWDRYSKSQKQIAQSRSAGVHKIDPPALTSQITRKYPDFFSPLASNVNEVYLLHGTRVRAALSIAQDDFRIDLAGSNVGTMYGRGVYLGESSTKGDEYVGEDKNGYYDGVFALLVCRACLGKMYYTTERDEQAGLKVGTGKYDSTCGDRAKSANTFREFVVYNKDQVYPEYVVIYSRIRWWEDPEAILEDFHMELPVYWANCHKDPKSESFDEQHTVDSQVRDRIQNLARSCLKGDGTWAKVNTVRRVENAEVWNRYVECKTQLRSEVTSESLAEARATIGTVMTRDALKDLTVEDELSVENLEGALNEHFLWHGTSHEAAEAIVHEDFKLSGTSQCGARFGTGVYCAEDLEKSFCYAKPEQIGSRSGSLKKYVLLCRVLCGNAFHEQAEWAADAIDKAWDEGKWSVLASPEGPREFIVPTAAQIYPEYIVEFQIDANRAPAHAVGSAQRGPPT